MDLFLYDNGLLHEKVKILTGKTYCLVWSDKTKLKVNNSDCVLFENLLFSMLIWLWPAVINVLLIKFFNWRDFFRISCFVILVGYWLIELAMTLFRDKLLFSISVNLWMFKSFLLKNGFIVIQNFSLLLISLTLIFSKYPFFVFLKRFT